MIPTETILLKSRFTRKDFQEKSQERRKTSDTGITAHRNTSVFIFVMMSRLALSRRVDDLPVPAVNGGLRMPVFWASSFRLSNVKAVEACPTAARSSVTVFNRLICKQL